MRAEAINGNYLKVIENIICYMYFNNFTWLEKGKAKVLQCDQNYLQALKIFIWKWTGKKWE